MPRRISKRRKYTSEFTAEATRQVEYRGTRTRLDAAERLVVAPAPLHGWRSQEESPATEASSGRKN